MNYEQALAYAKSGKAILFLGSGFSYGVTSVIGERLPTASGLALRLCKESNSKETDNLKNACKRYLKSKTPSEMVELLKDLFTVRQSTPAHHEIATIPWFRVYTTNYDNVFEVSAEENQIRFQSIDIDKDPRGEVAKKTVIHINGYINTLDEKKLDGSFKLTTPSYLTSSFRDSKWCGVFTRDVQTASAIFFIGYSMYDIEIQEILFSDKQLREKTFFIDREDLTVDQIEDMDIDDFGEVCPIGINQFAKDLQSVDALSIPNNTLFINNFTELKLNEHTTRQPTYSDIENLLSFGKNDSELLTNDILDFKSDNYIITREIEKICLSHLNEKSNLILFSSLANGKTVLANNICLKMISKGYKTFILKDIHEFNIASYEAEQIIKNDSKCIFVIENYTKNFELINQINYIRKNNTKLILISRTTEHERNIDDLLLEKKILDPKETVEECIDKLHQYDIKKFTQYLTRYGFWREKAGLDDSEKSNYIVFDAKKEISSILLGVLNSEQVQHKIETLHQEVLKSDVLLKTIVSILCLNIVNIQNPDNYLISTLTGEHSLSTLQLRSSSAFNHIVYKTADGDYFPKSSIFAKHFFQSFPDQNLLVEVLIQICKNVRNSVVHNRDIYMQIYRDLASYKNAANIVPKAHHRTSLVQFYEGLREIDSERRYPHFWLQYAIALISIPNLNNLQDAESHLSTSLSIAKKFNNYWIDDINTQFARCYIEKAIIIDLDNIENAYLAFTLSCETMIKVLNGSKIRTESLRPLGKYFKFYDKFKNHLSTDQIIYIDNQCKLINELIKRKLPNPKYNDLYYNRALKNITDISRKIQLKIHIELNK